LEVKRRSSEIKRGMEREKRKRGPNHIKKEKV